MKITIEPTDANPCHNTVSVANDYDEINIERAFDIIESALLAWGFSQETIDRFYDASKENCE